MTVTNFSNGILVKGSDTFNKAEGALQILVEEEIPGSKLELDRHHFLVFHRGIIYEHKCIIYLLFVE